MKHLLQYIYTIIKLALPISASGIVYMIANFICLLMVAQLGQIYLAASALAMTTYITIMTVSVTIFYSISILVSHKSSSSNHHKDVGLIIKNGIWCSLLVASIAALCLWNANYILVLFGQEQNLIDLTINYFHYASFGLFPLLVNTIFSQFFTSTGRQKLTLIIAITQLPLSVFFSYCFIFGKYHFPKLGLGGISCSAFLLQSIILLILSISLYYKDTQYEIFKKPWQPNKLICKEIFTLGFPIGIQFGGEMGAMSVATYFMGYFGIIALAASQIVSQCAIFVIMIKTGLTQAVSILTSKTYSSELPVAIRYDNIKQYMHSSMLILCGMFIIVFILFCIFPETLIKLYVNEQRLNPDLLHLSIYLFRINTVILFIDGFRHLFSGALRGLHDSQAPMRIGILSLWLISLPASYLVGFTLNGGPIGLRAAFTSGFIVATLILWARFNTTLKLKIID